MTLALPVTAQSLNPSREEIARDEQLWTSSPKTCEGRKAYLQKTRLGDYSRFALEWRRDNKCLTPSAEYITLSFKDLRGQVIRDTDYPTGALEKGVEGNVIVECLAEVGNRLSACRIVTDFRPGFKLGETAVRLLTERGRTRKPYAEGQRLWMVVMWRIG
ncbi:hypothetical protein AEYBE204_06910 [Asticcacaulis sp. YBE204]|nr:hypothetical protein AEYBE204_06910 [Asticcacaulis sp. YBE204]